MSNGKIEGSKREAALAEVEQEQSDSGGAGPEMAGATRDAQPEGFPEGMPGFPTQGEVRKSRETLRARMESSGELGTQDPRTAITVPGGEKKTARNNVVPSEMERQRETDDFGHKVAEDEFSDQRYRSRVEGFKPDANLPRPKSVMRAYADANRDAAEIVKALTPLPEGKEVVQAPGALGRPAEGFAMIEARLRAAERPTSGEGPLGGTHFILPVLKVFNGDKLGTYDFSPEEAVKATELRARAATILLNAKVSEPLRVRMARELATEAGAKVVNEKNVGTALRRITGSGKKAEVSPAAPKTQSRSTEGRDLGALPMHYKMPPDAVRQDLRPLYPGGTTTAQLMADGHRTATTRRPFGAVGDTFTVNGKKYRITAIEKVDLDSAPGRKKWAEREGWDLGYVQANLSGQVFTGAVQTVFEPTQAAPEVAAQEAPKAQAKPSGAGRKLNDWQPIETAPRDGSKILLFLMHGNGCVVAYWRKAHKTWDIPMHMVEICGTPTHWMPLPEEPITSTK